MSISLGVPLLSPRSSLFALALASLLVAGCSCDETMPPDDDAGPGGRDSGMFVCIDEETRTCMGNVHYSCSRDGGEFLSTVIDDCDMRTDGYNLCVRELGCRVCRPDQVFCAGGDVVTCNSDGTAYELTEECDISMGFACVTNQCRNLCEVAVENRSYEGCEFYGVDLDNASLGVGSDASAQQYSIVVSNPTFYDSEVVVEINNADPGEPLDVEEIERLVVPPGDIEIINLPRREVDRSSSMTVCEASAECQTGEACWCAGGVTVEDPPPVGGMHRDCRCRVEAGSPGFNDGTHSALTSQAFRVRSVLPVIAYQFNPLDNVMVFSNDASLLLPTSAIGQHYDVVGWPQTIADSSNPNEDFDPTRTDEDLRAFLTIVGTAAATHVTVDFGPVVRNVIGLEGYPNGTSDDTWEFDIGPFDVVNLETGGFNADFTGTVIDANNPVAVFVGSEASDVPRFNVLANRLCCADHLEEQLFPSDTLGLEFYIGRMPPRSVALNAAILDDVTVGEFPEPEYVRVLAVGTGTTTITTTLPPPDDTISLEPGGSIILELRQDMHMVSDQAVAVLQALPSQERVGIVSTMPGGDPAIIAVPPVEQYRQDYAFLTPNLYGFDFAVITAPADATVLLDDENIDILVGRGDCTSDPADGIERRMGDPPPEWLVYRCQFSYPDVVITSLGPPPVGRVDDGDQNDGYHTLLASEGVGLTVYGFDSFVSYAYAGGLNLEIIR